MMREFILERLASVRNGYGVCGIVDRKGRVYPLGPDTKVIGTVFEIIARQAVAAYAREAGLALREPERQNHYPDFTLMRSEEDRSKVAIDVKTTYRESGTDTFSYTLGGYTSYIRPQTEAKNILYPFSHYREHWIIGFVYRRAKGGSATRIHSLDELGDIQPPFDDVEVFMQRKWRIAGDRAGSGNTTNIGSIKGTIDDFVRGKGVFRSEEEFLGYWRGYGRTADERKRTYSNISEYRKRMQ